MLGDLRPLRIVFVAKANSVHTARWVRQLEGTGWDLHVFDATERSLTPELTEVTSHTHTRPTQEVCRVRKAVWVWPPRKGIQSVLIRVPYVRRFIHSPMRVEALERLIRELKPDIVHSLEMQEQSYPVAEVRRRLGGRFAMPWIYSSWGSDLYLFGKQREHQPRIREVLEGCDYYIADCDRDVPLAREYGFAGEVLDVLPVVGGFDIAGMRRLAEPGPPSARRTIAVKGYHGWAGRALRVLQALERCTDLLQGYRVVVYSASPETEAVARYLADSRGLEIDVLPPSPHETVVHLLGRSRLAIAASISDGWPNAMLEAMVMGAFPVQSDTVSTAEWIEHGRNGFLAPPEDADAFADAIRAALTDDLLVDSAAELNLQLTRERIDEAVVRPRVLALYERVAAEGARTRRATGGKPRGDSGK